MKLYLSKDTHTFLVDDIDVEKAQLLRDYLTYTVPYLYALRKKFPGKFDYWDGKTCFIDNNMRIAKGLWHEVYTFCKIWDIPLEIYGISKIIDDSFNMDEFKQFCLDLFKDHPVYTPYDYQIEVAAKIIKYRFSQSEIATSAGKTLISYMIFMWLKSKGFKKQLIIVPRITLVDQLIEDFNDYADGSHVFTYQEIYGGMDKTVKDVDFVVGTFQSLSKLPSPWFNEIDSLFVDECHTANATSLKKIILKVDDNLKIKYGMSGTINKDERNILLNTQSFLGPIIQNITPKYLMDNGFATPTRITAYKLNYTLDKYKEMLAEVRRNKKSPTEILSLERELVRNSDARFKFILDKVLHAEGNSLILFTDIKNGYGKRFFEYLRLNSNKNIYYIDGGTKKDIRNYYRKVMENRQVELIHLEINNKRYTFDSHDEVKLINGIIKKAKDIVENDEIDDNFLIEYEQADK